MLVLAGLIVGSACGSTAAATSETVDSPASSSVEAQAPQAAAVAEAPGTPELAKSDVPFSPPSQEKPPASTGGRNVALMEQIAALPQFGAAPGTTDQEWLSLQKDAALFFEQSSSVEGKEAEARLVAAGQSAWPALINRLIKLDPLKPGANAMGLRATLALSRARGSESPHGFDWRSPGNSATGKLKAADSYYNRRLTILLHQSWAKVLENPEHWKKFDKSDRAR